MELIQDKDTNTLPSHGELVEPSPVFQEYLVQEPAETVKPPLVISAEKEECLHH